MIQLHVPYYILVLNQYGFIDRVCVLPATCILSVTHIPLIKYGDIDNDEVLAEYQPYMGMLPFIYL